MLDTDTLGFCVVSFALGAAVCNAIVSRVTDDRAVDDISSSEMMHALVRRSTKERMENVTEAQIKAHIDETAERICREHASEQTAPWA